ncbi:MAG TPA: FG-GAP-like repeat-containing protein [Terriglobales bacterium]|nr:FG-GAP-like repeat-containing protein [Terriglobales bacterium]
MFKTILKTMFKKERNSFRSILLGSALAASATAGFAQAAAPPPDPALTAGYARLMANDNAGAVKILEEVTKREPNDGRALRVLAVAYQNLKNFDQAIAAFQHALEVEPSVPTPIFNLAVVYAQKGDKEQAFAWLAKARACRKIDMTQIDFTPELESLKSDPRFAALLPVRADFDNPFVEPVKIIREWDGEAAHDQFGWIARNIGDVDGDGVPDVVTSAPTNSAGGAKAGRIYVYSTKTGKLLWTADGHAGDQLGTGVEAAGDTNGDGIPDVIASAPGGGYAKVYSGRDGHVLLTLKAENASDDYGRHASGVGDVNHDGFADVIVGAPNNNAGGDKAGRAYVYSGKDGSLLLTLTGERAGDGFGSAVAGYADKNRILLLVGAPTAGPKQTGRTYVYDSLSSKPKFVIDSDETGGALGGMFLSVPGDVDGDGFPDVYASDWSNSARGPSTGRVYVHSGKDGHPLMTLTGETAGEGFGTSPSVAGDVDGDGHSDLIVGAWQYRGAAVSGGRAYLYSGKDGHLMKTYTCRIPGDTFGFDAVTMGDVDGDGTSDFLITSGWSGVHGFHSGRVFIISSDVKRAK